MNFVLAVLIGAVVGALVGYLLRQRNPRALLFGPGAGVVGGLVASVLATIFGDPGYGLKEAILQVVLAGAAGAGAVLLVPGAARDQSGAASGTK